MSRSRTKWSRILLAAVLLCAAAGAGEASLVGASLSLRADPRRVPADGETAVAVSVEVMDAFGRPAPDGTQVHFVSTLGEIISPVETVGGFAQTVLQPSNVAGIALVSAMVGAARATIEVEFIAAAGSAAPGSRMVELTAEELSYNHDKRVFVGSWDAVLRYQAVEIRADGIQYDVVPNVACAQGNVTLRSGSEVVEADALRWELRSVRGRLIRVSEEVERLLVEGEALETRADTKEDACLWEPLQTDDTRTWVKARRAVIDPGKKVILDHAVFYVDDTRVMSLRRHVVDPRFGGALFGNTFGYTSTGGVDINFPLYYRASGHHVGSLHVTRNRAVSGSQYDPGWSLGLKEEYVREGKRDGALILEDVLHPDRGIRWQHRHRFDERSGVNFDASVTRFDEDSPQLLSSGVRYYRPVGGGGMSLSLSGSDYSDSRQYFADVAYRPKMPRVGSGVLVTTVFHLRHSRSMGEINEVIIDPTTGEPIEIRQESSGSTTSPGVDLNFDLPSKELGAETSLTAGLTTGYAWGLAGGGRGMLDARMNLIRRLGTAEHVKLSYTYSSAAAGLQPLMFSPTRHRLNLSGAVTASGCHVHFNASQELGGDRVFGSVNLSRALPFGVDAGGRPLWTLSGSHFFSRFGEYRIGSSRLSLSRLFGRYRMGLCYSPQGSGIYDNRPWVSAYGYGYTYWAGCSSHLTSDRR